MLKLSLQNVVLFINIIISFMLPACNKNKTCCVLTWPQHIKERTLLIQSLWSLKPVLFHKPGWRFLFFWGGGDSEQTRLTQGRESVRCKGLNSLLRTLFVSKRNSKCYPVEPYCWIIHYLQLRKIWFSHKISSWNVTDICLNIQKSSRVLWLVKGSNILKRFYLVLGP